MKLPKNGLANITVMNTAMWGVSKAYAFFYVCKHSHIFYDSQSEAMKFLGFLLAIVEAHCYVYIVNDMQRPRANEKGGFHSSVSMKELPFNDCY